MFDDSDSLALDPSLMLHEALSSTAMEIPLPDNAEDTDSASEDERTLSTKYGLSPFLIRKFQNREHNITGIHYSYVHKELLLKL